MISALRRFPTRRVEKSTMLAGGLALAVLCGSSGCAPPEAPNRAVEADVETKAAGPAQAASASPLPTAQVSLTGTQLFALHCAGCHGPSGDGKGIAARFLFPKPRDFRTGRFRLVSTASGIPSADDLEAVLKRGMPGSSMPPWPQLSDQERKLLVAEVQRLHREGLREQFVARLKEDTGEDDPEIDEEEVADFVSTKSEAGEREAVPEIGAADAASVARGRDIYVKQGCVSCHGNEGRGDGQQVMVDSEGLPTRPRDLTRGIFKGEHDAASVYHRIALGMPGTPMPSSPNLTPEQIVDLVHYIRSLSDEPARQAALLTRARIVAKRVAAVPDFTADSAWDGLPRTPLTTMPLWWRDDANHALMVQAAHDGKSIVLRLRWKDTKANEQAGHTDAFRDAVAVQLHAGGNEPFLGMGDAQNPVDVWMWDAARQGGLADIEAIYPRAVADHYPFSEGPVSTAEFDRAGVKAENQPDFALPARAAGNPIAVRKTGGSSLTVNGPGSVTFRPPTSQLVEARGWWASGEWTVVMKRALAVEAAGEGISLAPGGSASIAFAIWEGGQRDRNGQKLVTIWQDLSLEASP